MSDSLAKIRVQAVDDGCGERKRRRRGLQRTDANRAGVGEGNKGPLSGDKKTT